MDWTTTCICVKSPTRLSALNPVYATNATYTEITSLRAHMGYKKIEIHSGLNDLDIFSRLHPADSLNVF